MAADFWTYIFYTFLLILMTFGSYPIVMWSSNKDLRLTVNYWNPIVFFLIAAYALLVGLRFDVGQDYLGYLEWYKTFSLTGRFPVDNEFGYVVLNRTLNELNAHYSVLFVAIAFFQIFFLFKCLSRFPFLSSWYFFFFFTTLLMFSSMNIMRQTIAYFIFFYTLILWLDKKRLQVLLFFLIALSFHKSVLIFIWVYPLLRFEWFKNIYTQLFLLFFFTFVAPSILEWILSQISLFVNLLGYQYYLENAEQINEITKDTSVGAGFGKFVYFLIDGCLIVYSPRLKRIFKEYHFSSYYNLYFLGAILSPIFSENFILSRTNDYLLNFRVLVLSFLCYYLYKSKTRRDLKFSILLIVVFLMLAFFYRGIYNSAAKCSPFQFITH